MAKIDDKDKKVDPTPPAGSDNVTPPEKVDGEDNNPAAEAQKDAQPTIDDNTEKVAESEQADVDGEPAPGVQVKDSKKNFDFSGSAGTFGSSAIVLAATGANKTDVTDETTFSDVDAIARNSAAARRKAAKIEARILRESTPETNSDEIVDVGETKALIYKQDTDIIEERVGGLGVMAGYSSPRRTEIGNEFIAKDSLVDFGDVYLHGTCDEKGKIKTKGQTDLKKFAGSRGLILNSLTPKGSIDKASFRYIRTGNYLLVGFNPLHLKHPLDDKGKIKEKETTSTNVAIGNVTRARSTTGANIIVEEKEVPVRVSTHETFKLLEVTPTIDDIKNATTDVAINFCCNETRMIMGQIEAAVTAIERAFDDAEDQANEITYPEMYSDADRSSLRRLFVNFTGKEDFSCGNEMANIIDAMRQTVKSEILWTKLMTSTQNLKSSLKFHKQMEGKHECFNYYKNVAKCDVGTNYKVPAMLHYLRTLDTTPKYDSWTKLLYEFKRLETNLEENDKMLVESKLYTEFLSKVKVASASVQKVVDTLASGKLVDDMGAAGIAKMGGMAGIILGVNINDFFDYDYQGPTFDHDGVKYLLPYICGGWMNARVRNATNITHTNIFNFAPTFVQAYVEAFAKSDRLEKFFFEKVSRDNESYAGAFLEKGDKYLPFYWQTQHPVWLDFFLKDLISNDCISVRDGKKEKDGFQRLFGMFENMGLVDVINGDISITDSIAKIRENNQLYPQENVTHAVDMPTLWPSAAEMMRTDVLDHQIAVLSNSAKTWYVYDCYSQDEFMFGLDEYEIKNAPEKFGDDVFADVQAVYEACAPSKNASEKSQRLCLLHVSDNQYIVVYAAKAEATGATPAEGEKFAPVIFRRRMPESTTGSKRLAVLADGAQTIDTYGEETGKQIFGHDNHYLCDGLDGYVLILDKGFLIGDDIPGAIQAGQQTYPKTWKWSMHPVLEIDYSDYRTEKGFSNFATAVVDAPRIHIGSAELNADACCHARGDNRNEKVSRYESRLFALSLVPSLYGHNRRCLIGMLDYAISDTDGYVKLLPGYTSAVNKKKVDDKPIDVSSGTQFLLCSSKKDNILAFNEPAFTGLHSYHVIQYRPYTAFDDEMGIDAILEIKDAQKNGGMVDKAGASQAFSAQSIDVSEIKWWDRNKFLYYNISEAMPVQNAIQERLNVMFADANKPVLSTLICDISGYDPLKESFVKDGVKVLKTPGNHLYSETFMALFDAFNRYTPGQKYTLLPSQVVAICMTDDSKLFTEKKPCVMLTQPVHINRNPVLSMKNYFADYRDWNYHKVFTNCNHKWNLYGNTVSQLAKTFKTDEV